MNERIHPPSEDLFAYRDGEQTPEKRAAVEAHVMGCSVCRSLIDQVSSLEAELRQSPDLSPAGYLDHLHESVRSKIAVAASEAAVEEPAPAGEVAVEKAGGRAGAYREGKERRRVPRDEGRAERRERGRVKEAPSLPWAAVIGTASAAAAVLVVVAILIKQGPFRQMVMPTPKKGAVTTAPVAPAPSSEGTRNRVATGGERDEGNAKADLKGQVAGTKQEAGATEEKNNEALKDKLAKRADEIVPQSAPEDAAGKVSSEDEKLQVAQGETKARGIRQPEASPRAFAESQVAPALGPEYSAILKRFGLPPVWDGARVSAEALANAEPELRTLYVSGNAGTDSARVRLYIAEAVRLRYAPGDAPLYDEILHHYRRVIEMTGPDSEIGRIAEDRLRSLEQ